MNLFLDKWKPNFISSVSYDDVCSKQPIVRLVLVQAHGHLLQTGFGWSNGVVLSFLEEFGWPRGKEIVCS
jgi:hypothetical protein